MLYLFQSAFETLKNSGMRLIQLNHSYLTSINGFKCISIYHGQTREQKTHCQMHYVPLKMHPSGQLHGVR